MCRIFTDVRRVLIRRGATTEFRNEQHGLNKSRHCFVLFWSDLGNGLESIQAKRHPTVRSISPHLQLLLAIYLYSKAVHNRLLSEECQIMLSKSDHDCYFLYLLNSIGVIRIEDPAIMQ